MHRSPVLFVTPAYYEPFGGAIASVEGLGPRVDDDRLPDVEARIRSSFGAAAVIEPPDDFAARIEDRIAVEVDGLRVVAVAAVAGVVAMDQAFVRRRTVRPVVVEGRAPAAPDEVAMGATVLDLSPPPRHPARARGGADVARSRAAGRVRPRGALAGSESQGDSTRSCLEP